MSYDLFILRFFLYWIFVGALNEAWKTQEKSEDGESGMDMNSMSGSPNKSPTKGIRRKRRKGKLRLFIIDSLFIDLSKFLVQISLRH